MPPKLALIGCIVVVLWLLHIERKANPEASRALWIPTFWLLIIGSRNVGRWFESGIIYADSGGGVEAGSPLDRLVLSTLILLALWVLSRRKLDWSQMLEDNFWLILLYMYLGSSILWSDFPFVSFKRWIRLSAAILMGFVLLTEKQPFQALESILRRCAYILIPFSLLLIKYFGDLGRAYHVHTGMPMWTGVTMHKNSLGVVCALSIFFFIWVFLRERRSGDFLKGRYRTFADALVLAIAVHLLRGPGSSYSATSVALLIFGIPSLLALYWMENITRWMSIHLKAVVIALALLFLVLGTLLVPTMASLLGRDETLTGRAEIWSSVLDVASRNPLLGVGYGGYWGLQDEITSQHRVHQSHNGYLDVYLQVGIVGVAALFAFVMQFCGKIRREFNHVLDWAVFGICFLLMGLLYNYTEASFLGTSYIWTITVFLTVVFSETPLQTDAD